MRDIPQPFLGSMIDWEPTGSHPLGGLQNRRPNDPGKQAPKSLFQMTTVRCFTSAILRVIFRANFVQKELRLQKAKVTLHKANGYVSKWDHKHGSVSSRLPLRQPKQRCTLKKNTHTHTVSSSGQWGTVNPNMTCMGEYRSNQQLSLGHVRFALNHPHFR